MELVQTYETTVTAPGTGLAFTFVVVPARSFPESETPDIWELFSGLEITHIQDVDSGSSGSAYPSSIAHAVTALLRNADVSDWHSEYHGEPLVHVPEREFAENLTFGEVVPFEWSPLGAESIAGVLLKGGGVAAGVGVGVAAAGPTPLLLIAVPAGMILCGAAAGVAAALEQGLRQMILRRLGVEEGQGSEAGATVG